MPDCYRDLVVWQKAFRLATECHHLAERMPSPAHRSLAAQLTRAAASVPANIAEGNGRLHRAEYIRFLSIALGSANEVESHLLLAEALGHQDARGIDAAISLTREVCRMLGGLIRALRRTPTDRR
ncbi:MAG: four helix bundle protein [Gemmatimonadaceae bacterium]